MKDQRVYLKVKLKSLAAEAKIIRLEEKRNRHFQNGLWLHRTTVVRSEARHTLLAYGFLKGRTYAQIERTCSRAPEWDRVRKMIEKYGVRAEDFPSRAEFEKAKSLQTAQFKSWAAAAAETVAA